MLRSQLILRLTDNGAFAVKNLDQFLGNDGIESISVQDNMLIDALCVLS